MILDSSVIVCLFANEPERARFSDALLTTDVRRLSAGNWVELSAVAVRKRQFSLDQLNTFCRDQQIVIEAVTVEQAQLCQAAYQRFGLGTGHRARLNFGDCFAYALAKTTGEPLLFKGDDFNHTDVRAHQASSFPG